MIYAAYDMGRYMRGKVAFNQAKTLAEMKEASDEMKQSHFKTLEEAKAWAESPYGSAIHFVGRP